MALRMPTRRSLIDGITARLGWHRGYDRTKDDGWRRVYGSSQIDAVLTAQSESAYRQSPDHAAIATVMNIDALHAQPAVLDVRDRVLDDALYLEGLLAGARNRRLPNELIECLQASVDHSYALAVLLAETARATTKATGS
ncbi:hypothetical protein ACF08B_38075 [Streptomyces sp. NPDC015139]|uniref:hypothetical protein n=1 Tax=Streptomyces sp. NPDC015139 TaxID=3364942 RepID=UPI0036FB6D74